ncbi:DUF6934 family protein [Runella sp.]|uniref:DUF6934 family protein n=1 Tax=Runella sp. TaxID=1960881 RepID=UPI003D125014
MDQPVYPYKKSEDVLIFEFESYGSSRISKKKIVYSSLEESPNLYSLSLFEVLEGGQLDIYTESRNKDMIKILSTVLHTIFDFFAAYPNSKIIFTGSTQERTRLYRIVIGKLLRETTLKFAVMGLSEERGLEPFDTNGNYSGYIVSLTI